MWHYVHIKITPHYSFELQHINVLVGELQHINVLVGELQHINVLVGEFSFQKPNVSL